MKPLFLSFFLCTFFFTAFGQSKQSTNTGSKPFVLGRTVEIPSAILGETRILNIYLPPGYQASDTTRYPVIYLLDGSADEDFIHVAGLLQFNNFPWVNRVPPSILVGIANVDRKRDFTFPTTIAEDKNKYPTTGHSDQFIAFIEKELQPYIDKQYRTNASKMLIGQSLGGLLASEILLKHTRLFNQYVIISPSLWWDDTSLLRYTGQNLRDTLLPSTSIYIGVGKEGETPTGKAHLMEEDAQILADQIKHFTNRRLTVFFDYLPEENHATVAYQALYNAFKMIYPKPD